LGNVAGEDPRGLGFLDAVEHSLSRVDVYVKEMIAVFGWRTTPAPDVIHVLWFVMIGAVVALALWLGTTKVRLLLLGLGVATLVGPAIIEGFNAETNGFAWQGRYALPLAVGIPIVATLAIGASERLSVTAVKRMTAAIAVVVAGIHMYVHLYVMRRYVVGTDGPTVYFGKDGWSPPLPAELLALATLAGAAGLALLTYRLVTSDEPVDLRRLLPRRRTTEPATA
jgi:peptidoglycan/LPS O-acetylase OafA/YrhL